MTNRIKKICRITGAIAILGCACFLLGAAWGGAWKQSEPGVLYHSISRLALPNGALLFRRGTGTEAGAVVIAEQGGSWSHVGLIASGPNGITVIHAVPAEEEGQPDVVKEDTLEYFLAGSRSLDAAVMVVQGAGEAEGETAVNAARHMIGRPFGIHPDGAASNDIYCTTLVDMAWKAAGTTLTDKRERVELPFFKGEYLFPDTLAASEQLTVLWHASPALQD